MITFTVITLSGIYCILILQDRYNREYFENLRKCYAPDHIPISPSYSDMIWKSKMTMTTKTSKKNKISKTSKTR